MAISKIQTGDKVKVISGNYKATLGLVTKVINIRKGKKIIKKVSIDNIPKIVKYRKKFNYQGENYPGAQLSVDRFIDASNVMLVDSSGKPSKTKIVLSDNKKVRFYKSTNSKVLKESTHKKSDVKLKNTK